MFATFTRSLRFQIIAALLTMLAVFAVAQTLTLFALGEQLNNQVILNLASRLQLTQQHLVTQAMHYQENTQREFSAHHRIVQLYYQDLIGHIKTFDMLCNAFMHREFEPGLTGLPVALYPSLDRDTRMAVSKLETIWNHYQKDLMTALGSDPEQPRLQAAAQYVIQNRQRLEHAANGLQTEIQHLARSHLNKINLINRLALLAASLVAIAILFWFYRKVIKPLGLATEGFRKVAQGDFGHQVHIESNNEIAWMTESFNHLSNRLYAIFRLIDHVQQGSDLDSTLKFVGEDFSRFIPLNWMGVLFQTGDGTSLKLEKSFFNGIQDNSGRRNYRLKGTLLELAMQSGEPQHIPDMQLTSQKNTAYIFLRELVSKGMRDAIFLPFADHSPVPGVLAFASETANVYTREHLELLTNIAHLVTHSFGRTVKLAEHSRLAAIGEFASGVAHEIRSPLATVSIALDYLKKTHLPGTASKRAELASLEAERMARLLDDMLLYAKPIALKMRELDLSVVLANLLETSEDIARQKHQRFAFSSNTERSTTFADHDRLVQIFLNLARNACEAAPDGSEIQWTLAKVAGSDVLSVSIHNGGDPIPEENQRRLFEPFFTTKPSGTGLGLSIVKRLVHAHGGDIKIESDRVGGTRTLVTLPFAAGTTSALRH